MGNTNSGWHLKVFNLQLAGTEEWIFFSYRSETLTQNVFVDTKKAF